MATKTKTQQRTAKIFGVIPVPNGEAEFWKFRMKVPHFPFNIDSSNLYSTKEQAEAAAKRWASRKVVVTIQ